MPNDRAKNYLTLLKIRQKAFRRNTNFLGLVFLLAVLATFAFGMLSQLNVLSLYLTAAVDIALLVSYLTAWVRLEIVNANIDLLNNLLA